MIENNDDLVKLSAAKARVDARFNAWLAIVEGHDLTGLEDAVAELTAARAELLDLLMTPLDQVVSDHRMADDYNPETGENDGIKYWERPGWGPGHDPG